MDANKIKAILKNMDIFYKDFYKWLSGLYDYKSGGFYYAPSSKTSTEFKPDIESTTQAFHILENSGLTINMPEWVKKKFIIFFQSRQDKDTGFL